MYNIQNYEIYIHTHAAQTAASPSRPAEPVMHIFHIFLIFLGIYIYIYISPSRPPAPVIYYIYIVHIYCMQYMCNIHRYEIYTHIHMEHNRPHSRPPAPV